MYQKCKFARIDETDEAFFLSVGEPVVYMENEHRSRAAVVVDDHCLVLALRPYYGNGKWRTVKHWPSELVELMLCLTDDECSDVLSRLLNKK